MTASIEAVDAGPLVVVDGGAAETPRPSAEDCASIARAIRPRAPEQARVFVTREEDVCFGDRRVVGDAALERLARAHVALRGARRVTLYVDGAVPMATVRRVMDALRRGGLDEVTFAVAPR